MIASAKSLEGQLLSGRYAVEQRLGSGSMGDVYLAEHTLMKKKVAVKVLHPEFLNNDEAVKRFQREAQAAAHIDHHNVCVATDFGETDDGNFFLVMEYLEGAPLAELIAEGEFEPRRAAHIARQVASGLVRAHALDIVHRDLKPDNIMVVERQEDPEFVKIMDFGVAHVRIGDAEKLTQAGTTYGTPAYMSPEQASGRPTDGRSDLYSLGIILYEMLTGAVPFFGSSIAVVMSAHTDKPVPPMAEVAPDARVPQALEAIVMKLLEKRPTHRFQSAEELEEALLAFERGNSVDEAGDTLQPIPRTAAEEARPARIAAATTEKEFSALSTGGHATVPAPDLSSESLDTIVSRTVPAPSKPAGAATTELAERARGLWAGMPIAARVGLVSGALGVLLLPVALVLAIWSATQEHGPNEEPMVSFGEPQSLADERDAFATDDDIAPAIASIATGNQLDEAAARLDEAAKADPENAHAHYFLGLINLKLEQPKAAVAAFQKAGEIDPRYFEEPGLIEAVFEHFDAKDEEARDAVRGFIAAELLGSEIGREALAAQAAEGANYKARHAARKILEDTGAKDKLERWRQVTVELRSTDNCNRLKKGVEELGEIGDPRGLPAVERISKLPTKGCGFLKRGDCYECLRGTVRKVKKKLEEADPVAAPAPAETTAGEAEGAGAAD